MKNTRTESHEHEAEQQITNAFGGLFVTPTMAATKEKVNTESEYVAPPEVLGQPISKSMDGCRAVIKEMKHKIDIVWFKGTLANHLESYKHRACKYPSSDIPSPRLETIKRFKGREITKINSLVRSYQSRRRQERKLESQARIRQYNKEQFVHEKTKLIIFYNVRPCERWRLRKSDQWIKKACSVCAAVVIQGAVRRHRAENKLNRVSCGPESKNILHYKKRTHILRCKLDNMRASLVFYEIKLRRMKACLPEGERPTKEDFRKQSAIKAIVRRRKKDVRRLDQELIRRLELKPKEGHVLTTPPLPPSKHIDGTATIIQTRCRMFMAARRIVERRQKRAKRLRSKHELRLRIQANHRTQYWTFVNNNLLERKYYGARRIQCAWRSMKARVELLRRKQVRARRFIQRVWRGCLARHGVVHTMQMERERRRFRHKILYSQSRQGAVWALKTWREFVVQEQLWKTRLYLACQIANSKWQTHCAIRIQRKTRYFLRRRKHHLQKLLPYLHPRLRTLCEQLIKSRNWHQFAQEIIKDCKSRNNPEPRLVMDAERIGFPLPLINIEENDTFVMDSIHRWCSWRPNPLPGTAGLIPSCFHYLIQRVNEQYMDYASLMDASCNVIQHLQEENMIKQLANLILCDTNDWPFKRWEGLGKAHRRIAMNRLAIQKDRSSYAYLRWFLDGEDLCGHCGALLSWNKLGKCKICSKSRYEMETSSVASRTSKYRLGNRSVKRPRIHGLEHVREPVFDFLCHAAFCVHAPAGHWRRLMPKVQCWEESRASIENIIVILERHNIKTIGSLWISVTSGEFSTLNIDHQLYKKIVKLLKMLHVEILTWLETGHEPSGSIILEDYDSTFLPAIPSRLSVES